jgi:hypothetical protein
MAFDWIKLDKTTPDKPEIAILARKLSISQGEAFLEWSRVYIWADGITEDGYVPDISLQEADRLSRCRSGTFTALASQEIGWVVPEGKGFRFANWTRHNGTCAKVRLYEAERKRKQRASKLAVRDKCPGNVPDCPGQNRDQSRVEKSRKEPPVVPRGTKAGDDEASKPGYSVAFLRFWEAYPPIRRTGKRSAWKAWEAARKRASADTIIAATREFSASPLAKSRYCPGPTPWLNQDRWDDERTAWQSSGDEPAGPHEPVDVPYEEH